MEVAWSRWASRRFLENLILDVSQVWAGYVSQAETYSRAATRSLINSAGFHKFKAKNVQKAQSVEKLRYAFAMSTTR